MTEITLLEGPPFISGKKDNKESGLHLGHAAVSIFKSAIMKSIPEIKKYWTGTDNHGLPMEMLVMDILGLKTPKEIETFGVDKFNKICRDIVLKYENKWDPVYKALGRDIDLAYRYKTMDTSFMESVWWAFCELYKHNLIYKGIKILPYDISSKCILSNFEANQEYQNIEVNSIYFLCKLINSDYSFIVWTTTAWTIESNITLCLNPKGKYMYVTAKYNNKHTTLNDSIIKIIVSENHIEQLHTILSDIIIDNIVYGKSFDGADYINPFGKCCKIIVDDFVEINKGSKGTGIVHIAPQFGEIDCDVSLKNNIIAKDDLLKSCIIDDSGNYINGHFIGINIFDVEKQVIDYLNNNKCLFTIKKIKHQYPFSPRTHKPLIYKICSSYFVKVESLKDRMVFLAKQTNWNNESAKNRFISWLENCRDWCISRNRYFGTPIPVWSCGDKNIVICSASELASYSSKYNEFIKNNPNEYYLHPEFIKDIIITYGDNEYKWCGDVFDCWFESGCVPFAQYHYPFENKEIINNAEYLSDYVCEGIDQTRGWFYTLLILSTALFDKLPYKNVICSGLIMDVNGKKFSKSSGNYISPESIINKYCSDALRLYLLKSPAYSGDNTIFVEKELKNVNAKLIQFNNSIVFFEEYMKLHDLYNKTNCILSLHKLAYETDYYEMWIITQFNNIIDKIKNDRLNFKKIVSLFLDFIEKLTNKYIKYNRYKFVNVKKLVRQEKCLITYYYILYQIEQYMKPFIPFTCNKIKNIIDSCGYKSYLLENIKNYIDINVSDQLYDEIEYYINIVRTYRSTHKLNNQYTLNEVYIDLGGIPKYDEYYDVLFNLIPLMEREMNTLNLTFACEYIDSKSDDEIDKNDLLLDNKEIKIDDRETEEVKERNFIHKLIKDIQQQRKIQNLHVYDKIELKLYACENIYNIVFNNSDYIDKCLLCDVDYILDTTINNYKFEIKKVD